MTGEQSINVDSSALLRVLLGQGGNVLALNSIFEIAPYRHSSRLTLVESERALARARIEIQATPAVIARAEAGLQRLFGTFLIWEISREICELAGRIAPESPLRSLDALHLATCQLLRSLDPDLRLVTCDRRLARAAGAEVVG